MINDGTVHSTQEIFKNAIFPVPVERYYCFHIHCFIIIIIITIISNTQENKPHEVE
jgi:hypothetical protein